MSMQTQGLKSSRSRLALCLTLGFGTGLLTDMGAIAQVVEPSPPTIFEDVTLSPSFSPDPATVRGISGGPIAAGEMAGRTETLTGTCAGFIDEQPDHKMELTQFFNYLSLQVESSEDTTLVIRGPGGIWCNDDYTGPNPGIAGQWLSGTYEIWIGSYAPDVYHPYVIRITGTR